MLLAPRVAARALKKREALATRWPVLLFIFVGRFGSLLQLSICLIEQVLCLSRMTFHVKFVGLLGGGDFLKRLRSEPLSGSQIRVARG